MIITNLPVAATPKFTQKQQLVYVKATSHKFWTGWIEKKTVLVHFGPEVKQGRTIKKSFPSNDQAKKFLLDKLNEKLRKGYVYRK